MPRNNLTMLDLILNSLARLLGLADRDTVYLGLTMVFVGLALLATHFV